MTEHEQKMFDGILNSISEIDRRLKDRAEKTKPLINGKVGQTLDKIRLNIGTVVSCGLFVALATWNVSGQLNKIEQRLINNSKNRWRADNMRSWELEARKNNPTLKIPSVDQILTDWYKTHPDEATP